MAIEGLKKHQGILNNTGARVVVVFRKLPNDETNCLIVETDRLPDSYHDAVMQAVSSKESLETNDFFEILNRRTFSDGSNCLTSLHQRGFMRKEPVTNIKMIPLPGQAVPLELINATIDNKLDQYNSKKHPENADEKLSKKDSTALARELLVTADLLEDQAAQKREEAYTLAPDLRPKPGRPVKSDKEKAEILEQNKISRRERDRAKAKAAKESKTGVSAETPTVLTETKVDDNVNAKVLSKLSRDKNRPVPKEVPDETDV